MNTWGAKKSNEAFVHVAKKASLHLHISQKHFFHQVNVQKLQIHYRLLYLLRLIPLCYSEYLYIWLFLRLNSLNQYKLRFSWLLSVGSSLPETLFTLSHCFYVVIWQIIITTYWLLSHHLSISKFPSMVLLAVRCITNTLYCSHKKFQHLFSFWLLTWVK